MSNYNYLCFNGKLYNMKYVTGIVCDDKKCRIENNTNYTDRTSPKENVFKCNLDDYLKYGCDKNKHDDKNEYVNPGADWDKN